ncbi:MAG: SUMF1/EgtB/PvdO family nonheme iron enzyme [Kiritimatiellia bacterium]|nr:SUMF1/EgtB/PvdO family nonheme iron enzyme [Kiritimatiellia bacterium]
MISILCLYAAGAVGAADAVPDPIVEQVSLFSPRAMRLAINDIMSTYPTKYSKGKAYLDRVGGYEEDLRAIIDEAKSGNYVRAKEVIAFQKEAMLNNPALDFDEILIIRRFVGDTCREFKDPKVSRFGNGINLGLPWRNSHDNCTIANPLSGWRNQIAVMTDFRTKPKLKTLYQPAGGKIVTDLELDFDAKRIMFSSTGTGDRWHVFEIDLEKRNPVQLTPKDTLAVDNFDSCYLPDGNIIYGSTAQFSGLPCECGTAPTAMPFLLNRKTGNIRQLGFDQETSWNFSVMDDGRVLYLRYEYTDLPHYYSRLAFTCNPDGTMQRAYYGSNSYWPTSFFGLRQMPGHPTKIIGTATGHHGPSRMGKLIILDPAKGTHETDGAIQVVPRREEKILNHIADVLYGNTPFKALTPWPLDEKYILTMMKPDLKNSLWGLYLVDVFDNVTLIYQEDKHFFIDPIPLKPRKRPPVIPSRVNLDSKTATVFLRDVHAGPGLKGIPRGAVKRLRVMAYNFSITHTGSHANIGHESSWDIKRILGTVPVEKDGSASFVVPANTPLAIQPLDKDGAALQLFRSWFTAMPGENVSCIGCHETSRDLPQVRRTIAGSRKPSLIVPWYGPARQFGFETEVQPVLSRRCIGCHNPEKKKLPDFTVKETGRGRKSPAYMALQQYVHRPGPESDLHLLTPMEFHASTSILIQKLKEGHHGVKLDPSEWEALYTWIDFNAPYHGSIIEQGGPRGNWEANKKPFVKMKSQSECLGVTTKDGTEILLKRRLELAKRYGGLDVNPEQEYQDWKKTVLAREIEPIIPPPQKDTKKTVEVKGWPFSADEARKKQAADGGALAVIEMDKDNKLELVRIPAGRLPINGKEVQLKDPFMMSVCEISNGLYELFDPEHDSKYIDAPAKDQRNRGYPANKPEQPVVRVSHDDAVRFCEWLSQKTGKRIRLPTEAQWEWACRVGTDTPLWFGSCDGDFSGKANLADKHRTMNPYPTAADTIQDGHQVAAAVTQYEANPWGLKNMHGNVAEWTSTNYERDEGTKVVKGGSWRDMPKRATSDFRIAYKSYQKIMNVGFRVVVEE